MSIYFYFTSPSWYCKVSKVFVFQSQPFTISCDQNFFKNAFAKINFNKSFLEKVIKLLKFYNGLEFYPMWLNVGSFL